MKNQNICVSICKYVYFMRASSLPLGYTESHESHLGLDDGQQCHLCVPILQSINVCSADGLELGALMLITTSEFIT